MSILIKGMEMPKNCALCKFRGAGETWCPFTLQAVPGNTIPEDCPLVPVPPHGRLGDLDALLSQYKGNILTAKTDYAEGLRDVIADIKDAPTIIPAEEEETT